MLTEATPHTPCAQSSSDVRSAGAGAQQQQGEAASSEKAGGGEPVRTVDVPAAGQPIRQNQAAVRERLMPKLAELEQVCRLHAHGLPHPCPLPAVWQLTPFVAESTLVCGLLDYMVALLQLASKWYKPGLPMPMGVEQGTEISKHNQCTSKACTEVLRSLIEQGCLSAACQMSRSWLQK